MTLSPRESLCHARMAYTFEGRQSVISHPFKVDNCFITLNIIHSAILNLLSSNLTTDTKWWPIFSKLCLSCQGKQQNFETREAHKGIFMGFFSCAVDITIRPNFKRLIERNEYVIIAINIRMYVGIFRWCNDYRVSLECGRSVDLASVGLMWLSRTICFTMEHCVSELVL